MSEGGSQRPGGLGKKRAAALQIELPCSTLDEVRAKHPELRSRRFLVRTKDVRPLDTVIRLDVKLSGGAHCLRATSVVERVEPEPEPGMTLWLLASDDAGRELIAWMGGNPPPVLKDSSPEAGRAAETATTGPQRDVSAKAAATGPQDPADDESDLVDPFTAFEAAAAAADRAVEDPKNVDDGPKKPVDAPKKKAPEKSKKAKAPPAPPPPPKAAPPPPPPETEPPPVAKAAPPPPPPETKPPPVAKAAPPPPPKAEPPAPPPKKAPPPAPPPPKPQRLGTVKLVSRAVPVEPAEPLDPPLAEPEGTRAPLGRAEQPAAALEWPGGDEAVAAREAPAARDADPWGDVIAAPATPPSRPARVEPEAAQPSEERARNVPPSPAPSRRPAPPPLPRPTLGPVQATPPAEAAPVLVEDVIPERPAGPRTGPIVGIDLGTTNSCAAVVKEGKPFIIPSREGYNTIPSVVAMSDKQRLLVGHPARGQMLINPKNTVYGAKRLVGRQFKSPVVNDLLGRFAYEITAGPRGEAAVKLGGQIYSLQKISSLILSEVKEIAQQWLGCPVERAVITVPAYYNDNQRQAVRAAGALAGFDVERIVNEPTAAAIAFAQGRKVEDERVLVYDLGGGTFDTSVLELRGNVYEVISTGGDTFLGGVDFDKAVVTELLSRFKRKHGEEFNGDRVALQRITDAAERAKMSLSERLTTHVNVPFVTLVKNKPCDLDENLTRAELEKLTESLIDRTLRVCEEVLTNCGLKPGDIGEVLLVGGQSRMPLVREKIRKFFGREPSRGVHPDEAVALGAALLADSVRSGDAGGIVLVDVLPMSIGVGLPGGRFKKVIERNTSLPYKKTYSIWTSEDDQEQLEIVIFQGESDKAQENEYLGTLIVPDLPPGTKGNVVFDIVFSVSAESILAVTAEERGTARTVTATFSTQDTPDAVRRRLLGERGADNPRLDEDDQRKRPSWMKRLFG
jgi:molecular chaperone DnaK